MYLGLCEAQQLQYYYMEQVTTVYIDEILFSVSIH